MKWDVVSFVAKICISQYLFSFAVWTLYLCLTVMTSTLRELGSPGSPGWATSMLQLTDNILWSAREKLHINQTSCHDPGSCCSDISCSILKWCPHVSGVAVWFPSFQCFSVPIPHPSSPHLTPTCTSSPRQCVCVYSLCAPLVFVSSFLCSVFQPRTLQCYLVFDLTVCTNL